MFWQLKGETKEKEMTPLRAAVPSYVHDLARSLQIAMIKPLFNSEKTGPAGLREVLQPKFHIGVNGSTGSFQSTDLLP